MRKRFLPDPNGILRKGHRIRIYHRENPQTHIEHRWAHSSSRTNSGSKYCALTSPTPPPPHKVYKSTLTFEGKFGHLVGLWIRVRVLSLKMHVSPARPLSLQSLTSSFKHQKCQRSVRILFFGICSSRTCNEMFRRALQYPSCVAALKRTWKSYCQIHDSSWIVR